MAIGAPVAIAGATANNYNSNSPSSSDKTTADAPIGSLIIVTPSNHGTTNSTITGCSDSAGNTYQIIGPGANAAGGETVIAWVITPVDLPINSTFTVTTSTGQWNHNGAWAISGCTTGIDTSQAGFVSSTPNTGITEATGQLQLTAEILLGQNYLGAVTYTTPGGWTNLYGAGAGSNGALDYKIVSSSASTTWAPTWTSNSTTVGWMLASFMVTTSTATIIGWAAAEY